jgi:molecular chaperone GrpE (heat shock protein)
LTEKTAQLEIKSIELEKKLMEANEKFLRLAAEFDN